MRRNAKGLSAHYFLRVDWPSVQCNAVFNYPIARHPSAESGRSEGILHALLVIVLSTNLIRAACDKIVSLARHHGNALFVAMMLYLPLPGRS